MKPKGSKKKPPAKTKDDAESGKPSSVKRKVKEVEQVDQEDAADQDQDEGALEKKRRQSRKSSAYHKAKAAALKAGKSEDEAKALGKQAI